MVLSALLFGILPIVVLLPLLFWAWMFQHMANNPDIANHPGLRFRWPPMTRQEWTLAFIVLSIIAAAYYYATVYRSR